jgi:hypothetical protein
MRPQPACSRSRFIFTFVITEPGLSYPYSSSIVRKREIIEQEILIPLCPSTSGVYYAPIVTLACYYYCKNEIMIVISPHSFFPPNPSIYFPKCHFLISLHLLPTRLIPYLSPFEIHLSLRYTSAPSHFHPPE